jgi:hypothetical protein
MVNSHSEVKAVSYKLGPEKPDENNTKTHNDDIQKKNVKGFIFSRELTIPPLPIPRLRFLPILLPQSFAFPFSPPLAVWVLV